MTETLHDDGITIREVMREVIRRGDELARELARMNSDTVSYRARHHDQIDKMNVALGRLSIELAQHVAINAERLDHHEGDIGELKSDFRTLEKAVNGIRRDAAFVSGGVSGLAWLLQWWPWGKH